MRKNLFFLCTFLAFLLVATSGLNAQTLRGFNYQAVARDASGNLLSNQNVTVVLDIRQGSAAGALIYQETHNLSTNTFGLFNLVAGKGTPIVGDFEVIDWAADDYFMGVTLNGTFMGASELEAVPFSKLATDMTLDQLTNVEAAAPNNNQVLKFNGTSWAPANDNNTTYSAGSGLSLSGTTFSADDPSPTNEIQILSLAGSTLSLSSGGGSVSLPAGTAYTAGAGISISGGVISNTGDTNAANDITNTTPAGGDLSGTYPNPTVAALQGIAVSTNNPNNNQVLKYNGTSWAPANDNNTTYSAGSGLSLSGTTFSANDPSATNEIQTLSLSGTTLSLSSGGGSVSLPAGTTSPWTTAGANIFYNTGNVGIGDATPAATFTVGNGDKFQVDGAQGDLRFTDDDASIQFPAATPNNSPMIYMFTSGTQNAARMAIAHSPSFPTWGLEYNDTVDVFHLRSSSGRKFSFELSSGNMGVGIEAPAFPIDLMGRMRLRSTGSISNSPGIWFSNLANTFDRAFIGMAEPDSVIGIYSQHMGKFAIEFEIMREPRIGINIPNGSPPRSEVHLYHTNFGGSNDGVRIQNEGSNAHYWNLYTSNTTGAFEFFKQGIKRATIDPTSGAFTAVSDERLKTNIQALPSVLPSVLKLQAKTYQFTDGPSDRTYTGYLAQELQVLFPQYVYFGGDDQKLFTVDYAGMSVVAIKAIQEQQEQIVRQQQALDDQTQLIQSLLKRVEALEQKP